MEKGKRDRALVALQLGFALVLLAFLAAILAGFRSRESLADVSEALQVQNRLGAILSNLQDAETGQRGYLLNGQKSFLEPYRQALSRHEDEMEALELAVADDAAQDRLFEALRVTARDRLATLRIQVENRQRFPDSPIDVERMALGKLQMDKARIIIALMKKAEVKRYEEARAQTLSRARIVVATALGALLAVAGLGVFAYRDSRKRLVEAIAARDAASEARTALERENKERQAAEAQLRQLQKMEAVGQLTGGVAHDFNNMLSIVIGSLDLSRRRLALGDTTKAAQGIDNAMEGAERAAQLTAQLLAFSRQQPLAPARLDMNKLVRDSSEMLRRLLTESIQVETVLSGGLWPVHADRSQLENAIINLCVNARDAMPDGGKLSIETSNSYLDENYAAQHGEVKPGQYVMVSVTDTGSGMTRETIDRAFDPFFTTKETGKGTGLGLSQVFGFVKQTGGHVKIYSEPGIGTAVKVYMPRYFGDEEAVEAGPIASGEFPGSTGNEVVLVAEDEEGVRRMSVDVLTELGYKVLSAGHARDALAFCTGGQRIDLLFTDIVMPDTNGRVLAEEVGKLRPGIKVLYTTGYTRNAVVHNGIIDPGLAFLPKPFTVEALARKIRQVLDEA